MVDPGISDRVKAFLADHIDSIVQLEILLLLRSQASREFSAADVAEGLRISSAWAAPHLAGLCAQGMLSCTAGTGALYRFAPASPALNQAIDELAHSYAERRVSVTSLIFSRPASPLRDFADAFRLRRDLSDG